MTELKRQECDENGYVSYPGLVDPSQLEILLAELDRISDGNTLAAHDKTRLEMEPNRSLTGGWFGEFTSHAPTMRLFRELSDSPKLLDAVETLLGPDLVFHYSKINMKPPSIGSVVEWHQDLSYYPLTNASSLAVLSSAITSGRA